jgi:hypothetical protein
MYERIEQLGQSLRPTSGPRQSSFLGHVIELSGEEGPSGRVEGEVVLQLALDESTKARVTLNADEYEQAVIAHVTMRVVLVSGVLHRAGRRIAEIRDTRDFHVFDLPKTEPPELP